MQPTHRVLIAPRALADLEEVFEYIRQDSPQNAARFIGRLIDAIDGLNILPYRFNVPRNGLVRGRQVRSMPVPPYLVRYRIDDAKKLVYVLRVRHGARRT